jgi:hypothetical protein
MPPKKQTARARTYLTNNAPTLLAFNKYSLVIRQQVCHALKSTQKETIIPLLTIDAMETLVKNSIWENTAGKTALITALHQQLIEQKQSDTSLTRKDSGVDDLGADTTKSTIHPAKTNVTRASDQQPPASGNAFAGRLGNPNRLFAHPARQATNACKCPTQQQFELMMLLEISPQQLQILLSELSKTQDRHTDATSSTNAPPLV